MARYLIQDAPEQISIGDIVIVELIDPFTLNDYEAHRNDLERKAKAIGAELNNSGGRPLVKFSNWIIHVEPAGACVERANKNKTYRPWSGSVSKLRPSSGF